MPSSGPPGEGIRVPGGVHVEIVPRADGLLTREQAARLCDVTPEAITNWVRGYGPKDNRRRLPVARRENGRPLFDPVEVAKAENATARRARRGRWSAATAA
jgi:hypothetical protein